MEPSHTSDSSSRPTFVGGNQYVKKLIEQVVASIQQIDPSFSFTSLQVNEGLKSRMHFDSANVGNAFFISLGPYVGGQLWVDGAPSEFAQPNTWHRINMNHAHRTTPFASSRVSSRSICITNTSEFGPPTLL